MITYTLTVVDIIKETSDAVTIRFKQPGLRKVKYLSGQYLTLIFKINGRRYIRPYSFSSCPVVDSYLEVTVKRVNNGIVSNHINDMVKVGDIIEAFPPSGDFTFKEDNDLASVYLWGVGSGITPLISIAKNVLYSYPDVKVNLIYGNRTKESTIFSEKISLLQNEFFEKFIVRNFLTQYKVNRDNPDVVEGRIDYNTALTILNQDNNLSKSAHYICGPYGLKESIKKVLSELNLKEHQVFFEDFELVKDPKDFIDIETQKIRLEFENDTHFIEIVKGKTILESALDASIDLPYSCQTGNCSFCKANILEGEVKMIGLTHERKDLKADEVLLCCAHPLSSEVLIKI